MQHRSDDRVENGAPDPVGSGAPACARDPEFLLRGLVHDTANWLQRFQAHLDALESRPPEDRSIAVQRLREGIEACASLGQEAVAAMGGGGSKLTGASHLRTVFEGVQADQVALRGAIPPLQLQVDEPGVAWAALPATLLANILTNLVENAWRASTGSEPILLRARSGPDEVWVEVCDRGRGMDEQTRKQCLGAGVSTKDGPGHGLGIPGVRAALARHGARLEIHSRSGEGTTVRLRIPPGLEPRAASPVVPTARAQRWQVVEDDPEVREVLVMLLRRLGHEAEACSTARDARAGLEGDGFDGVLIDQRLPDAAGLELAEEIRQRHPDLVLVLLTGDPRAAESARLRSALDGCGVKPLGLDGIRSLLEDACRDASLRAPRSTRRERPAHG